MYYGRRLTTLLDLTYFAKDLWPKRHGHFANALKAFQSQNSCPDATIAQNTEQGSEALTSLLSQKSKNQSRSSWYGTSKMRPKLKHKHKIQVLKKNVILTASLQLYLHKNSRIRYQSKGLKKKITKKQTPWNVYKICKGGLKEERTRDHKGMQDSE